MKVKTLVLKVASRCNLNCTYCYMYNVGDNSYLKQPKFMSNEIIDAVIEKTLSHCTENEIKDFHFVFHGGEPLLLKKEFFYNFVERANKKLQDGNNIKCNYQIQTNALLISKEWCGVFNVLNIDMGISLDGRKKDNDKFRVGHNGEGSYDGIVNGLKIAQKYTNNKPGLLCVININSSPEDTYFHFKELNVKAGDFLIPYATIDKPPNRTSKIKGISKETPYADWLIRIFNIWFYEEEKERLRIRIFDSLIRLILGRNSSSDNFGNTENEVLLIETDGGIEPIGALKLCGDGFTKAGANIVFNSFKDALQTPLATLYHKSHKMLPKKCTYCPINEVCGGGHISNRFSKVNGFNNPSVYCNDFMKLILHIQNSLIDSFPEKHLKDTGFEKLMFDDVKSYMDNIKLDTLKEPLYSKKLNSY